MDFKMAVACVRSTLTSNLEMRSGLTGHLQNRKKRHSILDLNI